AEMNSVACGNSSNSYNTAVVLDLDLRFSIHC
uniref:Uncharacterized protein n=1 Tax=Aegilops tauschii subsp. strangulata TaxID=200361 RepID=A0A453JUX0_AEGTS